MTPHEAFAHLGLTAPASADQIRRGYLRAVRAHPPERDADGFRRVRDAYELLKDAPWLWGLEPAPASFAPPALDGPRPIDAEPKPDGDEHPRDDDDPRDEDDSRDE